MNGEFYKGKKVLITGNTGFKGSWLSFCLLNFGANVVGYSLEPPTNPSLYEILQLGNEMNTYCKDIRDYESLHECFAKEKPEIVFHLAAQPIVRESYRNPRDTYECNVMGTVNVLESARCTDTVRSLLNVTTDKVYRNNEWEWGYREEDILDGYDPYSNSKSCSELVTASYKRSFFAERPMALSTVRAGNVIGGGDFAVDRIIPDCLRAIEKGEAILVRNPHSIRPYQHVLEPLDAYMLVAERQYEDITLSGSYNVGPEDQDCISTGDLVNYYCELWEKEVNWHAQETAGPHEANFLRLDSSRIKNRLGWHAVWGIHEALEKTVEWQKAYLTKENMREIVKKQLDEFAKCK